MANRMMSDPDKLTGDEAVDFQEACARALVRIANRGDSKLTVQVHDDITARAITGVSSAGSLVEQSRAAGHPLTYPEARARIFDRDFVEAVRYAGDTRIVQQPVRQTSTDESPLDVAVSGLEDARWLLEMRINGLEQASATEAIDWMIGTQGASRRVS